MIEAIILPLAILTAALGCSFSVHRVNQYIEKYRLRETPQTLLFGTIHLRHIRKIYITFLITIGITCAVYLLFLFL